MGRVLQPVPHQGGGEQEHDAEYAPYRQILAVLLSGVFHRGRQQGMGHIRACQLRLPPDHGLRLGQLLSVGDNQSAVLLLGIIGLQSIRQRLDPVPVGAAVHPVEQGLHIHICLSISVAYAVQVVPSKGEKRFIVRQPRCRSFRDGGDLCVKGRDLPCHLLVQFCPFFRFQGGAIPLHPVGGQIELGLRLGTVAKVLDIELWEHPVVYRPQQQDGRQDAGPPDLPQLPFQKFHQDTSFLSNQPRANRTPPPKSSRFSPLAMVSCQGRTAFSPSSVNQALQESQTVTGWKQAIK